MLARGTKTRGTHTEPKLHREINTALGNEDKAGRAGQGAHTNKYLQSLL